MPRRKKSNLSQSSMAAKRMRFVYFLKTYAKVIAYAAPSREPLKHTHSVNLSLTLSVAAQVRSLESSEEHEIRLIISRKGHTESCTTEIST